MLYYYYAFISRKDSGDWTKVAEDQRWGQEVEESQWSM